MTVKISSLFVVFLENINLSVFLTTTEIWVQNYVIRTQDFLMISLSCQVGTSTYSMVSIIRLVHLKLLELEIEIVLVV